MTDRPAFRPPFTPVTGHDLAARLDRRALDAIAARCERRSQPRAIARAALPWLVFGAGALLAGAAAALIEALA